MRTAWTFADHTLELQLHVQPGAKKSEIVGRHGDAFKLRIQAKPVDGAANKAVIAFLAKAFGVAKGDVCLLRGERSREKRVQVQSVTQEHVAAVMASWESAV